MNQSHYDSNGRPLVPPAERPFVPYVEQETVQETVWFNPTEKDAVLDLYVGTKPVYSPKMKEELKRLPPAQLRELRTGLRRYIIRAGERRSIPSEFDQGIQQTHCQESDCASRPMYCRDMSHHHLVVGGLGPQLINEKVQHRPTVHPSLIEAYALEQEAQKQAMLLLQQNQARDAAMVAAQAQLERAAKLRAEMAANAEKDHAAATPAAQQTPAQPGHEKKGK